jgi:hypothetical protein
MIRIYNVIIDEKEIIGVGPLMRKAEINGLEYQLFFEIYTRQGPIIRVSTNWFQSIDSEQSAKKEYADFEKAHIVLANGLLNGLPLYTLFPEQL